MHYVYIIQSIALPEQLYTGFTGNVEQRLEDHNAGKSAHTNKFKPWRLVYFAAFAEEKIARGFEKYLKTGSGKAFRNKRLI